MEARRKGECEEGRPNEEKAKIVLDLANKKRNTAGASRWAMSPVHSPSAPSFRIRRRNASPTTVGLFPECPDATSPMKMASDCLTGGREMVGAPVADQRGSNSNQATADCPPASRTQHGTQNRETSPIRIDAAAPPGRDR